MIVGRTLHAVILEVGWELHKKTRVLEKVDEPATRRCAALLSARFMSADPARREAPRHAHVQVECSDWELVSPRLNRVEWDVWDVPGWLSQIFTDVPSKNAPHYCSCQRARPHFTTNIFPSLYEHQQEAVRAAISKNGSLYLADEMGLGKTRSALAVAAYYAVDSLLIVAPASLRFNWLHETQPFFGDVSCVDRISDLQTAERTPRFAIVSYAMLAHVQTEYSFYIFDECHYLKNVQSARTKAALRLTRSGTARVVLLSGTPLSRNADLFAQLQLLGALPPTTEFYPFNSRFRKCAAHYFAFRYTRPEVVYAPHEITQFTRNRRSWELRALLARANFLRRTLADANISLPPKVRETFAVGRLQRSEREKFQRELRLELPNVRAQEAHLTRVVLRTADLKRHFSLEFLRRTLPEWRRDKTLLFAHYHSTLDAFESLLLDLNVPFVAIDGRVSAKDKEARLQRFRTDASVAVALLGIHCASTGLNLQCANRVVFTELGWNPDDYLQAEARAHRLGSVHSVSVVYLLLPHSADDVMYRALQAKHANSRHVLNDSANAPFLAPSLAALTEL